jgi:REP element-mobilizing transposase RayT
MNQHELLLRGHYYHIYNRGINSCNLFRKADNYKYFLELYDKHISPIADTYAWVLMPNHFHLLVRIKDAVAYQDPQGFENLEGLGKEPHQYFSNLFNSYTKAINKSYHRTGSLFEHPFHRKRIANTAFFRNLVVYIHNNPFKHGYKEFAMDYPWSSYLSCISLKQTKLKRDQVLGWFDDRANFRFLHNQNPGYFGEDEIFDV